jgi:hypothetical protein
VRSRFPNPFYVLLMVVSTLFMITSLAYLVGPMIAVRAMQDPGAAVENRGTAGLTQWLDAHAPTLLGVEFVAMLALGLLAMATDHWFEGMRGRGGKSGGMLEPGARVP